MPTASDAHCCTFLLLFLFFRPKVLSSAACSGVAAGGGGGGGSDWRGAAAAGVRSPDSTGKRPDDLAHRRPRISSAFWECAAARRGRRRPGDHAPWFLRPREPCQAWPWAPLCTAIVLTNVCKPAALEAQRDRGDCRHGRRWTCAQRCRVCSTSWAPPIENAGENARADSCPAAGSLIPPCLKARRDHSRTLCTHPCGSTGRQELERVRPVFPSGS